MRTLQIALLILAALPLAALSTATVPTAGTPVELVEGHTVAVSVGPNPVAREVTGRAFVFGAPVGQPFAQSSEATFAGTRWFNDQYVADPRASVPYRNFAAGVAVKVSDASGRTPCRGALLVTDAGGDDPRLLPWAFGGMQRNYLYSDLVTDPNDRTWTIDTWSTLSGLVHTVGILNGQAGLGTPDDGAACSPIFDSSLALQSSGGRAYPSIEYNAFVFAYLGDFSAAGATVDHRTGAATRADSPVGGNSHAFDPIPSAARAPATFHGGQYAPFGVHQTREVALYYGVADQPYVRQYRYIDTEGALAPFGGDAPRVG